MTHFAKALICAATLALFSAAPGARAHEGHGENAPAQPAQTVPRVVAEGSGIELVATAEGHKLTIYLDRSATNTPVEGAKIEVMGEAVPPGSVAKDLGNGIYEAEGEWVDAPGVKPLTFLVVDGETSDLLAGVLTIPDEAGHEEAEPALWANPVVWLWLGVAAFAGFFLSFAFRPMRLPADESTPREAATPSAGSTGALALIALLALGTVMPRETQAHEGHDHGGEPATPVIGGVAPAKLPTGEVFLPKATQRLLKVRTEIAAMSKAQAGKELVGTVIADPAHEGRVQAPMDGQIELASGGISYVGKPVKAGEVLAVLAPAMPVYERGTLAQVTADVEGKLRIAEQKLARLNRISGDYIPQREIEDTKTEIESLRQQKHVLAPKNEERMELKAPVDGIISVSNVRAGQVVTARDTLFEIVDPKELWIEAIGIAGSDDQEAISDATAVDAEGHRIPLSYIGRAPSLRQQALPILFKVDEPHASLAIGATVKVLVQHGAPVEGVVVPTAAVVRAANGLAQVWVKIAPEKFAAKTVRTAPLDGERVIVRVGLGPGDRFVTDAAEIINQVR